MTRPDEILGEVVTALRVGRREGARVSELVADLTRQGYGASSVAELLEVAFCLDPSWPNLFVVPRDPSGAFRAEALDALFEEEVDDQAGLWLGEAPYPDLLRRCDRHAFRAVARRFEAVVLVQAANPASGKHVGAEGVRPAPLGLDAIARSDPPHAGLLAADPEEERLLALLAAEGRSHQEYLEHLRALSLSVAGAEDGHLIRDAAGNAFHPTYRLHGVYHPESGTDLWTRKQGEAIRAALNLRLGAELVLTGPHDTWDRRLALPPGHPLRGAQLPVLAFSPNGNVTLLRTAHELRSYALFLGVAWDRLYPSGDEHEEEDDEELLDPAEVERMIQRGERPDLGAFEP